MKKTHTKLLNKLIKLSDTVFDLLGSTSGNSSLDPWFQNQIVAFLPTRFLPVGVSNKIQLIRRKISNNKLIIITQTITSRNNFKKF